MDEWKERSLHSSTFRLDASTYCEIRWVHSVVSVTETAQVKWRRESEEGKSTP